MLRLDITKINSLWQVTSSVLIISQLMILKVYIQISFRGLDKKLYSDILIDRNILNNMVPSIIRSTRSVLTIPSNTDENYLGKALSVIGVKNIVTDIPVIIKGVLINFLDKILEKNNLIRNKHKDIRSSFDMSCKFYYIKSRRDYILIIKVLNDNQIEKLRYSISGVLLSSVVDTTEGNMVSRSSGSETYNILDNIAMDRSKKITFKPIESYKAKSRTWLANPNIGVIDLETYLDSDNIHKVYALGFRTNIKVNPVVYYIEKKEGIDSNGLVLNMINELLRSKYNNITFYSHNLGGYDIVFLLKVLYDYNDSIETETETETQKSKYIIIPILRDDKIIKVTIRKGIYSLVIQDSYCVLTSSIEKLSKDFGVNTSKTLFPYKFSTWNHLEYIGSTPTIDYYDNISMEQYNKLYTEIWSFKAETLKYIINDLNCLFEIINCANTQIFKDYQINITDSVTISGLAMKIYLSKFYGGNIPRIMKPSIYRDIKQGYYGGITEVYKPYEQYLHTQKYY
uniref:Probable DNA polymerase n=1 Tax=Rhynchosporium secalis TaxID=38038 RepID=V5W5R3_RHYSE|nr:hypothetical protein [Rhynchosporium secalis]AHC02414.1 hypothetical protein [Rhynchosporium secalis]